MSLFIWGIVITFVIIAILSGIRIVNQYHRAIVLRFGKFKRVLMPGFRWVIPIVDTIPRRVDIRERVIDMKPQQTMTTDKVSLTIDAIVMWRIKGVSEDERRDEEETIRNCIKNELEVKAVKSVMRQKAEARLREVISSTTFSDVLGKIEEVAKAIKDELDKATDRWGVDVTSVQIRDIQLPEAMQRKMALKAEADIEKQARKTKAEAEKAAFDIMSELGEIAKENPAILELRKLQTVSEIGSEQNTTIVMMMPSGITELLSPKT